MLPFDWILFLRHHGIEYVTVGPNVAKGFVNIRCPLCQDDPSHHMGLALDGRFWGCWRDPDHRGRQPERLIVALLHCGFDEAKRIVGTSPTEDVGWSELLSRLEPTPKPPTPTVQRIRLLPEFFQLKGQFLDYLAGRGFGPDAPTVAAKYRLMGARTGEFRFRLIFPVLCDGLVGWTARAITRRPVVRYKAHPPGNALRSTLYNYDPARAGGHTLAICEGPVDVLKVDYYGEPHGIRAIGLMGLSMPPQKLARLLTLSTRFKEISILLDTEAYPRAVKIVSELSASRLPISIRTLPKGVKDPGMLTKKQVHDIFLAPAE